MDGPALGRERLEHGARPRGERVPLERRERGPRREDRIIGRLGPREKCLEPPHEGGDHVVRRQDLVEALGGIGVDLGLRDEIVGDPPAHAIGRLATPRRERVMELRLALREARLEDRLGLGRLVGAVGLGGQKLLGGAREDPVERVVVGRGHGIVFVVVAAGAGHGQAHRRARQDVDAVVDDLVRHADEAPAQREEAHRRGGRGIVGRRLVRGELQDEEAVVGKILVEGPHDPVPVGRRMHPDPLLTAVHVTLRVGVAGEVEPSSRLLLAVVRRCEQSVDESLVGVGRRIGHECLDVVG